MSLLELDHVSKRYRQGSRQIEVLREVCLELHERELIAVLGTPGSGRSTLLRIAAGIDAPEEGAVRFRGEALSSARSAIARGIVFCPPGLRGPQAEGVIQALISAQLALGISRAGARSRALAALERVGAAGCEGLRPQELDCSEAVRVSIAAALLREPALLLVDEPTVGVAALEQDEIALLLRSLTREDMAILMSVDETGVGMFAADRTLSLDQGRLRGHVAPELGEVVELPLPVTG